jgi:hypothetical protein
MSKNIAKQNQMNLWGKQTDAASSSVLEPQRTDLFLVDLTSAAKLISKIAHAPVPVMFPQYVRSIALPESIVKPEVYRRDSIPYNMPGWDDPIGAVKVTFLLDTWDTDYDKSDVIRFLDLWVGLTRAGRGARGSGFTNLNRQFILDDDYGVRCQFDIYVSLLRGALLNTEQALSDVRRVVQLNDAILKQYEESMVEYRQQVANVGAEPGILTVPSYRQERATLFLPDMLEHAKWRVGNAWCAGYKLQDLSYTESQVMSVEATFYPESIESSNLPYLVGSPVAPRQSPA